MFAAGMRSRQAQIKAARRRKSEKTEPEAQAADTPQPAEAPQAAAPSGEAAGQEA